MHFHILEKGEPCFYRDLILRDFIIYDFFNLAFLEEVLELEVIIIMGSDKDLEFSKKIQGFIKKFDVKAQLRIASAHKTPLNVFKILDENSENDVVFITVAGKSNALSGFADANTTKPVIACPPIKRDKLDTDIFSSLSMPSGVAPMTVLDPENAGLAALKILALNNKNLQDKINDFQKTNKERLEEKDKEALNG